MILREGSEEDKALAQRFADKRPEPDDLQKLAERWQKPFQKSFDEYLSTKNALTPALLERFSRIDPTFAESLLAMGGVGKMANVYQGGLLSLAVNHPEQFKGIRDSVLSYQKHEKIRAKALEKAKEFGFDAAKYDELVKIEDAMERGLAIEKQVKSRMTGWGRFFNYITGEQYSYRKGKEIREAMKKERDIADAVETALVGTAHDNAEIRAAFAHEAMDRKPPMERNTMSFTDLRDLRFEHEMVEEWKKDPRSQQIAAQGTTEADKRAAREAFRDQWKADKKAELQARGGLWAHIAVIRLNDYDPDLAVLEARKQDNRQQQGQQQRRGGGQRGGGRRRGGPNP